MTHTRFVGYVRAECRVNGRAPKRSTRTLERIYATGEGRFNGVESIGREKELPIVVVEFELVRPPLRAVKQLLIVSPVVGVIGV